MNKPVAERNKSCYVLFMITEMTLSQMRKFTDNQASN